MYQGRISHHFGELLSSLKKHRAIWGIAAIVSPYRAIWGHYSQIATSLSFPESMSATKKVYICMSIKAYMHMALYMACHKDQPSVAKNQLEVVHLINKSHEAMLQVKVSPHETWECSNDP